MGILLNNTNAALPEVKKAYATALYFDPYNTAAMMNLIGPLVLEKEYLETAVFTAKALKLRPEKPLVLAKAKELLKEFMDIRDIKAAKILLRGWTEGRPNDTDAWHNLGLMHLDHGELDEAIRCFVQVSQITPEDNFAIAQLAKLYYQKKKAKECIECCNKLLQRGHDVLLAVSLKARVLNLIGGYEQALEFIQPYIEHSPNNDALWVVLAEIHEYRDNYKSAIEALQNARGLLEINNAQNNSENLQFITAKLKQLLQN